MINLRREIRPMLALALPLVLAEVGWIFMAIVDTVMVGRLPHPAIAISAVALAQVIYNTVAFGIGGILLGLDTYISQSHGAGKFDEANRWLLHGLMLTGILCALLMSVVYIASFLIMRLNIDATVLVQAQSFLRILNLGTPTLLLAMTLRRYLQAFNHVKSIALILVTANVVNALGDWWLLFPHHLGSFVFGDHGVAGAAVSTAIARLYMAAAFAAAVGYFNSKHSYGLRTMSRRFDAWRLRQLAIFGAPVGGQIFVEISIFAVVTAIIGTFGPMQLAGHELALNCASFTFMVPFAISAAAAVRVGQAIGRRAPDQAAAAGWAAITLGAGFMLLAAVVLVAMPHAIARAFTIDRGVIAAAVPLLLVAAAFQFFDGIQVTAAGALRGAGNTHTGLIVHFTGYWLVGLPVGLMLAFHFKLGAVGLWTGLCVGLMFAGLALIVSWQRAARNFEATAPVTS
jgi:MATE family multidrug resistance protein